MIAVRTRTLPLLLALFDEKINIKLSSAFVKNWKNESPFVKLEPIYLGSIRVRRLMSNSGHQFGTDTAGLFLAFPVPEFFTAVTK